MQTKHKVFLRWLYIGKVAFPLAIHAYSHNCMLISVTIQIHVFNKAIKLHLQVLIQSKPLIKSARLFKAADERDWL